MLNTTLCYIRQGDQYLMLHRVKKKNDINHHKWIGIGGKFEELESPEDCLLREVLEETGLTLTSWQYRGIVTFVAERDAQYMHLFTADGFCGQLKTCEEGDLEWVPIKKLPELPIWEGDKIFLRLLEEDAPFFSLKLTYDGDRLIEAVLDGVPLEARQAAPVSCGREREPLLISACLMGLGCRYDGACRKTEGLEALSRKYHLIPICPEQLGGLATPRAPAEQREGRVITKDGTDVTAPFYAGAQAVGQLADWYGCRKALLKERSPSCGHGQIYDGSFSGKLTAGSGITARLLKEKGLEVLGESRWEEWL